MAAVGRPRYLARLKDTSKRARPVNEAPLPGVSYRALDRDPSRWTWDAPPISRAGLAGACPRVGVTFDARIGSVEFGFEMATHADVRQIRGCASQNSFEERSVPSPPAGAWRSDTIL